MWYGCDDSGWSLLERDAIVWVYEVGGVWSWGWGVSRDCGGQVLSSLQLSVLNSKYKKKGYGQESGAGDS